MAPTAALPEQQPLPFTFTSPVSSERHEDAVDFDYESWIQQSKITNCYSKLWLEDAADAQAINRHHREMMLQAVDNLPEEAYELSLRDLSDLNHRRFGIEQLEEIEHRKESFQLQALAEEDTRHGGSRLHHKAVHAFAIKACWWWWWEEEEVIQFNCVSPARK
nr:unnamed protein product [Digitaria exilis]